MRVSKTKLVIVFLAVFVIYGFLYIQFYDFPRQLNDVELSRRHHFKDVITLKEHFF